MEISFLGASQEVGRSAFLVESRGANVLMDCGVKANGHGTGKFPEFQNAKQPHAAIITHGHLDHFGFLPSIYKHAAIPTMATFPTIPIMDLLLQDTMKLLDERREPHYFSQADLKKMEKNLVAMPYNKEYEFFNGDSFELIDAGHIIGSSQIFFHGEKDILYTGDMNVKETHMHKGAEQPKQTDVLIIESTYGNKEHPNRAELEERFCYEVREAIAEKCLVVIPCFAVSRTQEIMMMLKAHGLSNFVLDGMGAKVSMIMLDFPSYFKNPELLSKAISESKVVEGASQRSANVKEGNIIITTAGMMEGGPALSYIKKAMQKNIRVKVMLTGFQVPGTNGRRLLDEGMVRIDGEMVKFPGEVTHYDFSAHAGKTELLDYVKRLNPEKVFCVHGDPENLHPFRDTIELMGFDVEAPAIGDKVEV